MLTLTCNLNCSPWRRHEVRVRVLAVGLERIYAYGVWKLGVQELLGSGDGRVDDEIKVMQQVPRLTVDTTFCCQDYAAGQNSRAEFAHSRQHIRRLWVFIHRLLEVDQGCVLRFGRTAPRFRH